MWFRNRRQRVRLARLKEEEEEAGEEGDADDAAGADDAGADNDEREANANAQMGAAQMVFVTETSAAPAPADLATAGRAATRAAMAAGGDVAPPPHADALDPSPLETLGGFPLDVPVHSSHMGGAEMGGAEEPAVEATVVEVISETADASRRRRAKPSAGRVGGAPDLNPPPPAAGGPKRPLDRACSGPPSLQERMAALVDPKERLALETAMLRLRAGRAAAGFDPAVGAGTAAGPLADAYTADGVIADLAGADARRRKEQRCHSPVSEHSTTSSIPSLSGRSLETQASRTEEPAAGADAAVEEAEALFSSDETASVQGAAAAASAPSCAPRVPSPHALEVTPYDFPTTFDFPIEQCAASPHAAGAPATAAGTGAAPGAREPSALDYAPAAAPPSFHPLPAPEETPMGAVMGAAPMYHGPPEGAYGSSVGAASGPAAADVGVMGAEAFFGAQLPAEPAQTAGSAALVAQLHEATRHAVEFARALQVFAPEAAHEAKAAAANAARATAQAQAAIFSLVAGSNPAAAPAPTAAPPAATPAGAPNPAATRAMGWFASDMPSVARDLAAPSVAAPPAPTPPEAMMGVEAANRLSQATFVPVGGKPVTSLQRLPTENHGMVGWAPGGWPAAMPMTAPPSVPMTAPQPAAMPPHAAAMHAALANPQAGFAAAAAMQTVMGAMGQAVMPSRMLSRMLYPPQLGAAAYMGMPFPPYAMPHAAPGAVHTAMADMAPAAAPQMAAPDTFGFDLDALLS